MDRIACRIAMVVVAAAIVGCRSSAVYAEEGRVRRYKFNVVMKNTTRLCSTKPIVTVNGKYPGPTIVAREDDTVLVKVVNHVRYNVTIHWHGVRQFRTGWADGPAYITQCPIQPGQNYVHRFNLKGQRGTLFWHAHISWLRATVHGAIVILPKRGIPYPFPRPDKEAIVILGEWWKSDVEAVISEAMKSGFAPNVSDAHTINGYPGLVTRNCHSEKQYHLTVERGKRYMLRIINTALNEELFFKVAYHKLTVVEVDASYVKPFDTDTIVIAPGQTTNAILVADQPPNNYAITVSTFMDAPILVDNATATATVQYSNGGVASADTTTNAAAAAHPNNTRTCTPTALTAAVPPQNATYIANKFINSLRSLNSKEYPAKVPLKIDRSLLFTVALGINPCPTCNRGMRLVADFSNITFVMPKIALLQAHFFNISGVFTDDFPEKPLHQYDYTGTAQPSSPLTRNGTKVYRLPYNASVQLVLQDTGMIAPENHPIHLHGYNFYVVGRGVGNYDPEADPKKFNVVDPVERNTVDVPSGGWAAIRFRADNPGVWFMHCHLEVHTSWGLKTAFIVDNGNGPNECLLPPPRDLPKC